MGQLYIAANGAMPTSAALVKEPTGTVARTMLQIATPSTEPLRVVEWGISFDGSAAATPVECELFATATAQTGLAAHVASGLMPFDDPNSPASSMTLGAAATGYWSAGTAPTEVAPAAMRLGDAQLVAPSGQYVKQFPLGREFGVGINQFLRIRVTAAATVNCYCYVIWLE